MQAILEEKVSVTELRGMLRLRRAEIQASIEAETTRLARVEARLLTIEVGEVFGWLDRHGLVPAGPPFFKYNVIDMARELEMEGGVPVATAPDGDDQMVAGVLPAGQYATLIHVGHPSELMAATKVLLDWAAGQGLTWDVTPSEDGDRWACRLENYLTDPGQEPDMSKWVTQLAFKLAD